MEGATRCPPRNCFCSFPKLRLWILEHVWAHKPTDLHQVLDLLVLPEMDVQPLSLEDSWRLRVASAQVYFIVKNRDAKNFEKAMDIVENMYRLLPRLVAPIKHMKIVFGLKTMFIMWMLREGRGMVETMLKINHFFPNKLPQYQGQCSQRDMFLMSKNHVDFRSVAQALTMDRAKLKDYILNEMEGQYGEHYAQKVEDRLLHYLNELETTLPRKTRIDGILDKSTPDTEEERLLLDVVTADSASIGTTLRRLLHCDVVCCSPDSPSPQHGTNGAESGRRVLLQAAEDVARQERRQSVCRRGPAEHRGDVAVGTDEGLWDATPPPQFCSKHGQWVETILKHCTDETEELSPAPASPLLFLSSCSSSSGSSSDDLTPSDLIPQRAPSQTPSVPRAEHTFPEEQPSCGWTDDASQTQWPLQPSASQHGSSVDVASTKASQASPDNVHINKYTTDNSSNGATFKGRTRDGGTPMETDQGQASPGSVISRQPPTQKSLFEPSRMFEQVCQAKRPLQALEGDGFEAPSPGFAASRASSSGTVGYSGRFASTCNSESLAFLPQCSACQVSPSADWPQSSTGCCHQPHETRLSAHQSPACTDASFSSDSTHVTDTPETSRVQRPQLRLSLPCQAALLQSKLFQPYVSLTRLSSRQGSSQPPGGQEEDLCYSFDPNTLYSSYSSSSGGDDSLVYDPDYKPRLKKKQLLREYEAARTLI